MFMVMFAPTMTFYCKAMMVPAIDRNIDLRTYNPQNIQKKIWIFFMGCQTPF